MKQKEKILVIAAHPDDEVLGVGGTMAKKALAGHDVYVVIMATGIAARYQNPNSAKDKIGAQVKVLRKEAEKAADILMVKKVLFLDFPDNRLDTVAKMDIVFKLKEIVEKIKPNTVYTHHYGDYNWDHGVVYDVTLMACRQNAGDFAPQKIYAYEVLSSTERGFRGTGSVFVPHVYEDIGKTISAKKKAMNCYKTELRKYPHPRSLEAVEYLARKRGSEVSIAHAEAFQLIRELNH